MFLVLTSAKGVSDETVKQAVGELNGAEAPRRLSDCAVDIRFHGAPPELAIAGVDVNCVSAANRRKKLLIADMDSTIIPVECIDELADMAGVKDQVAEITEKVMLGEMNFEASIDTRVAMLAGLSTDALQNCYDERISLNPGARTLVQTMNGFGAMTALISGGFTFFTEKVAAEAGFLVHHANRLEISDDQLTGKVLRPILGPDAKLKSLYELCKKAHISSDDVAAVGDGANDILMIKTAGLGVAYRAKPALKDFTDIVLDNSDLTALLSLQGIAEADYFS